MLFSVAVVRQMCHRAVCRDIYCMLVCMVPPCMALDAVNTTLRCFFQQPCLDCLVRLSDYYV